MNCLIKGYGRERRLGTDGLDNRPHYITITMWSHIIIRNLMNNCFQNYIIKLNCGDRISPTGSDRKYATQ
jgi:hypothetical protein